MGQHIRVHQLEDYSKEEDRPIKNKKQHKVKKFKDKKDK